ncbi:MAG: CPBP family intramembrane glutamic endopeptidase [Pseudomonadota bacterium]
MKELKKQFEGWEKEAGVTLILAAVLMTLFAYQGHPDFFLEKFGHLSWVKEKPEFYSQAFRFLFTFVIFFVIPALTVLIVYRKPLASYGLALGDKKFGLRFVAVSFVVAPLPLYLNAGSADFLKGYPLWPEVGASAGNYVLWIFLYLVFYIGWEFFFRGFMQFSLKGRMAPFFIIMIQTLASTIIHIGKPEGETLAAIVGGIIFGAVALRTRSSLYPLLVHWYLGALTELFTWLHMTGGGGRP